MLVSHLSFTHSQNFCCSITLFETLYRVNEFNRKFYTSLSLTGMVEWCDIGQLYGERWNTWVNKLISFYAFMSFSFTGISYTHSITMSKHSTLVYRSGELMNSKIVLQPCTYYQRNVKMFGWWLWGRRWQRLWTSFLFEGPSNWNIFNYSRRYIPFGKHFNNIKKFNYAK